MAEKFGADLRIDEFDFGAIAEYVLHRLWCRFTKLRDSLNESVRHNVELMRASPFVPTDAVIRGFIYDIKRGLVEEVRSS